jgi:hypothetical protein
MLLHLPKYGVFSIQMRALQKQPLAWCLELSKFSMGFTHVTFELEYPKIMVNNSKLQKIFIPKT